MKKKLNFQKIEKNYFRENLKDLKQVFDELKKNYKNKIFIYEKKIEKINNSRLKENNNFLHRINDLKLKMKKKKNRK